MRLLSLIALLVVFTAGILWTGRLMLPPPEPRPTETVEHPAGEIAENTQIEAAAPFLAESEPVQQSEPKNSPLQSRLEPLRRDIRDVTPSSVTVPPEIEGDYVERLPAVIPPKPPVPTRPVGWPKTKVLSAGTLKSGKQTIKLTGIEVLESDAVCGENEDTQWPCGNFAKAALQRLIRGRTVKCDPVGDPMAQSASNSSETALLRTRCVISGHDIGEWLVEQGWARALQDSPYAVAQEAAQAENRGLWSKSAPR